MPGSVRQGSVRCCCTSPAAAHGAPASHAASLQCHGFRRHLVLPHLTKKKNGGIWCVAAGSGAGGRRPGLGGPAGRLREQLTIVLYGYTRIDTGQGRLYTTAVQALQLEGA